VVDEMMAFREQARAGAMCDGMMGTENGIMNWK
jgi:hypothetical protein